ncbi:AAA family ATPase [Pedobacter sp. SL55]|uniref:AAA family ATPase n=1 Tax=Pedobacter sp. SL55 TaxID=2995161 RepID=UPI00227175D9|nr:AAA family ATPase [Pedobacter sp. SL55]WAC40551.1 AAA family ATPase [Pedobacter sp. SL55]
MNNETKEQIREQLRKYVSKFDSQNKAALSLKNVSVATVSNIINGKWEKISDEIFISVKKQISEPTAGWNIVETDNLTELNAIYTHAATYASCFIVTAPPAAGKTATAEYFKSQNADIFLVKCDEFWNRKTFLLEILKAMGINGSGATAPELVQDIIRKVNSCKNPELIFDEFDKVNDQILCSVISIFNRIENKCGIVVQATDHLERRLTRGLRLNKRGYQEFWSRFGSKVVNLEAPTNSDMVAIIKANGIESEEAVYEILNDADNDLRRVKKLIQIHKHN